MKTVCLVDVDEVLCDFVGGAFKAHGIDPVEARAKWPANVWSMEQYLDLTEDEFWEPIHAMGEEFWINLAVHPWAHGVIDLVARNYDEWFLATKPSRDPYCYAGKAIWIKRLLGDHFDNYFTVRHKHRLAKPGWTLIDDNPSTVEAFMREGRGYAIQGKPPAHGILFPGVGNSLRAHMDDPVAYLRNQIDLHHALL